ncbi:MAG: zf-TFIIB domain-containing protein [Pyrinomonadaceae bacterium]
MKIEALNCPNCGASVADNSNFCDFCDSRLKTMACARCFGTIFEGSNFCPLCGEKAFQAQTVEAKDLGDCPRCKIKLKLLQIDDIGIGECEKCEGVWVEEAVFEEICADHERQAAVLKKFDEVFSHKKSPTVQYVPCPECGNLMNRSNFARVSGVIIDSCRRHGLWFDAEELPRIIEFIRKGGLDHARQKEKLQLEAEKDRLRQEKFKMAVEQHRHSNLDRPRGVGNGSAIGEFISSLFD